MTHQCFFFSTGGFPRLLRDLSVLGSPTLETALGNHAGRMPGFFLPPFAKLIGEDSAAFKKPPDGEERERDRYPRKAALLLIINFHPTVDGESCRGI